MDERLTYLALEVGWALPPILLQWVAGWRFLYRHRWAWFLSIAATTLFLSLADSTALGVVWTIAPGKSLGLLVGNVPVEEIVFFLVTNTLVVQSILLVRDGRELVAHWRGVLARTV